VVGVVPVQETDDLMLITLQGMVTRIRASEVRVSGRNTQGVRVITPNEGDKLASVAKVAREEVADAPSAD
jgi:DNA gyrase subunit A